MYLAMLLDFVVVSEEQFFVPVRTKSEGRTYVAR
jgi:hypothetical protein